jgi:hypothetical protein
MSDDDDFPHLAEERRAYRRRVTFAIVGVLLGATALAIRIGIRKDKERDIEMGRRIDEALANYQPAMTPPASASSASSTPDHDPIELELVYGSRRFDVEGVPIELGDGRTIVLEPAADWTYASDDLSFTYSSSLRVRGGDVIFISSRDATAEISLMDSPASDAADLAEMTELYTSTGRVTNQTATTRNLLGKQTAGVRLSATGLVIELLTARVDKRRRLRAIVTGNGPGSDLAPLLAAIETMRPRRSKPTPEYTAVVRGASGNELGHGDLAIGGRAAIGEPPVEISLVRRAMVRERLSGIDFEHAPELSAIALDTAGFPAVQLRSGEQGIQIMVPPMGISASDLLAAVASGATVKNQQPVVRDFAGTKYDGVRGELTMGAMSLVVEVFPFQRGARNYIATLQYPAGGEDAIVRLAGPVLASVE